MKRIPIALLVLALACASAQAASVDDVLTGLRSYWTTVDTFTARFVQKKHLALFTGDVTSRGTFAYRKPGDLVFRYDPPEDAVWAIKPEQGMAIVYFPSIKKATRYHFSSEAGVPRGMSIGMVQINDVDAMKKAFTITVEEAGGITALNLMPKDTNDSMKGIRITIRKDYALLGVKTIEKNGDWTTLDFSDQRVNSPVDGKVFDVTIPAGVVIEDIGK